MFDTSAFLAIRMARPRGLRAAITLLAMIAAQAAWAVWQVNPAANLPVCTQSGAQTEPVLLRDGKGGVFVGWHDARGGEYNVYLHHVMPGGYLDPRWPAAGLGIAAQAASQQALRLHADPDSGVILVWWDQRSGSGQNYAHRVGATGQRVASWPATGLKLAATTQSQYGAVSAPDGAGGVVVAWSQYRGTTTTYDVVAQRASAAGTRAWDSTGVVVCAATGPQYIGATVSDGSGGMVIAWMDDRSGTTGRDIYAHRVLASGALDSRWPANGLAVCAQAGAQEYPTALPDGAGGAFIAWSDSRGGTSVDLYLHHVRGDGTLDPAWPAGGRLVRDSVYNVAAPMFADGAGGMTISVATVDLERLVSLRLRPDGTTQPGWPATGVALDWEVYYYGVDGDGAGGLVYVAEKPGPPISDLDAFRLRGDGTWDPAWPTAGAPVSRAAGVQTLPAVVQDGAGGLITAWVDGRNLSATGYDVYAQRVLADGTLGHPEPAITSIADVPGDEGGRALVAWSASEGDALPNGYVSSYLLWRRVLDTAATEARLTGPPKPGDVVRRGEGAFATWWEFLARVPAARFGTYAYTVETTADARPGVTPWNVFVVDAADDASWSFYPSAPDSGYSVDNLAPHFPAPCFGWYAAGATRLSWPPSPEPDFSHYRLYRLPRLDSPIDASTLIATLSDTGYVDSPGHPCYYVINAVDVHGNSSPNGLIDPFGVTGTHGSVPGSLAFDPPQPNPAGGPVTARFGLPARAAAELTVHDVHGRLVRRLALGVRPAGWHTAVWDGRDASGRRASPGVYLVRLATDAGTRTARIVRLE